MAKIGYVGLGTMGGRMVERLMKKGHSIVAYNRTKSKAQWLVDKGVVLVDSPREVAEQVEIVFSMVTNTKAVEAITQGPDGIIAGLSKGKIYVDMSTMSPTYSQELAKQVEAAGALMLDAPVSGSVVTLVEGKLSVMVGGEREAFDKVLPIFQDIGPKVTHVGGNGLAVVIKIAANLGLAVQMLAFSESVLIAEKAGIPRDVAVEVLTNSVIGSPMVKYRGPFVLGHPEDAWFDCWMMQKDMNLALELGQQYDIPLPTTAVTNEYLNAAKAIGLGKYDFAIIFDVLARNAGIDESTLRKPKK